MDPEEVLRAAYADVVTPLPGRMPTPPPSVPDATPAPLWEQAFDDVAGLDPVEHTEDTAA